MIIKFHKVIRNLIDIQVKNKQKKNIVELIID